MLQAEGEQSHIGATVTAPTVEIQVLAVGDTAAAAASAAATESDAAVNRLSAEHMDVLRRIEEHNREQAILAEAEGQHVKPEAGSVKAEAASVAPKVEAVSFSEIPTSVSASDMAVATVSDDAPMEKLKFDPGAMAATANTSAPEAAPAADAEEEVMLSVNGVMMKLSDITEADAERMTTEEYEVCVLLCCERCPGWQNDHAVL